MKKVETTIYSIYDMKALEIMTPKEVIEVLRYAYRKYINKYPFLDPVKKYSDEEYYNYKVQCAFSLAYQYLEGIEEDD